MSPISKYAQKQTVTAIRILCQYRYLKFKSQGTDKCNEGVGLYVRKIESKISSAYFVN